MRFCAFVIGLSLLVASQYTLADSEKDLSTATVFVPESIDTCAHFNDGIKYPRINTIVAAWLAGYITSSNIAREREIPHQPRAPLGWMIEYCSDNPSSSFLEGVREMDDFLQKNFEAGLQ